MGEREKMAEERINMRIIIYGSGAVGGVIGGLLALTGTQVILIGRQSNVDIIREHGLRVITPGGTKIVQLPAVTAPAQIDFGPADVVFLCVKGQDTEIAMRDLHAVVKDIPVFCFQNGVHNEEVVSKYFTRIYGVSVEAGVVFTQDGEVTSRSDPPGRLMIGWYPEGIDELVESVAKKLHNAGFEVVVTPEIMSYKWGKLIANLTNAVVAITNTNGDEAMRIAIAAQNEGKDILAQASVRWIPMKEPPSRKSTSAVKGSLGTPLSSTWQSLIRRNGTVETDFLNGEIVRLAKKLNKPAPINKALLSITQDMAVNRELPGKYTPAELARILKLE